MDVVKPISLWVMQVVLGSTRSRLRKPRWVTLLHGVCFMAHLQAPAMMSLRDGVWLGSYKLKQSLSPPSLWPWCFIKATEILTKTAWVLGSCKYMTKFNAWSLVMPYWDLYSPKRCSCSLLHGWCDSHKKLISFIIINTMIKMCMEVMHCWRLFLVFLACMVVGTRGRKQTSPSR